MSARELDPVRRGLKLALFSWKLILIILSTLLHFFSLLFIYWRNIDSFQAYDITIASVLGFSILVPTFRKLRLSISLSFKTTLLIGTLVNIALFLWASEVAYLVILAYALNDYLTYISI